MWYIFNHISHTALTSAVQICTRIQITTGDQSKPLAIEKTGEENLIIEKTDGNECKIKEENLLTKP